MGRGSKRRRSGVFSKSAPSKSFLGGEIAARAMSDALPAFQKQKKYWEGARRGITRRSEEKKTFSGEGKYELSKETESLARDFYQKLQDTRERPDEAGLYKLREMFRELSAKQLEIFGTESLEERPSSYNSTSREIHATLRLIRNILG